MFLKNSLSLVQVRELSEDIQEAQRNKDSSLETGTLESLSSQVRGN